MTVTPRVGLLLCVLLSLSCQRTDIVAGPADAGRDGSVTGGPPVPDAGPEDAGREDTGPMDAGRTDTGPVEPNDAGAPPDLPRVCPAETCASTLSTSAAFCDAARPAAVVLGDSCDATSRPLFAYAACSCTDLVTNSEFVVDALDGSALSASIAVNQQLRFGSSATIDGSIFVSGRYSSAMSAAVSGDIVQAVSPRCVCDEANLLNTQALIQARATDNDNAPAQLTASSLNGFTSQTLALDCGRYYFDRVVGDGSLQIEARGRIALFIAGELGVAGALTLTLASGASAEIFVGSNVRVDGPLELSTTRDGNRVLLAVNGTGTIDLAGALVDGSIYAPRAEIVTRGPFELNGSLFVKRANFGDRATLRYQGIPASRADCSR